MAVPYYSILEKLMRPIYAITVILAFIATTASAEEEPMKRMVPEKTPSPRYNQDYIAKIVRAIRSNIMWDQKERPNAQCEVDVELDTRGNIVSHHVATPQENSTWYAAVVRALNITERIPLDENGHVPPRLDIIFKSKE